MLYHSIAPVFDARSRILILGSFPSVKSREVAFFYGHPQNRFWSMLAAVYDAPVPQTVPEKKALLLEHGVALWDVLACCEIEGSADSTIRHAEPNELQRILTVAPIERILLNGKTAEKYYKAAFGAAIGCPTLCLPSTSPANAAWSKDRLTEAWRAALLT